MRWTTSARHRQGGRQGCSAAPLPAAPVTPTTASGITRPPAERPVPPPQYYHSRDVALRLKHQDELRRRSGPEAPGSPRHSRAAAGEAARQWGLGETREQEEVRGAAESG